MKQSIIQVPVNKGLRDKAKKAAQKQGFSSLQEMIRVFLSQFVEKDIQIGFIGDIIKMSSENEKRYIAMLEETEASSVAHSSVEDVMRELS